MRVLFLAPNAYMSPAFSEQIYAPRDLAMALVDGLVKRGHDVTFVTASDVPTTAKKLSGNDDLLAMLAQKLRNPKGLDPSTARLVDAIRRDYEIDLMVKAVLRASTEGYDVVHMYQKDFAHYFDELFGATPTVYTLHDPIPQPGTLAHLLYSRSKNHRYVAISHAQQAGSIGLNIVGTVYHGIDVGKYPFAKTPASGFVFMGRLVPEKGADDAIKACVIANERLLIGSHFPEPKEETAYYHSSIAPMLDDPLIEEIGMVKDEKKSAILGKAKALLFPVKWEEPFGMVMIEAMATGTPVIAYNGGSVAEIVKDGVTGFIVEPTVAHDSPWIIKKSGIEGLVAAMRRIGEIDRAACRKHVEERFTVEEMAEGYENVYRRLTSADAFRS